MTELPPHFTDIFDRGAKGETLTVYAGELVWLCGINDEFYYNTRDIKRLGRVIAINRESAMVTLRFAPEFFLVEYDTDGSERRYRYRDSMEGLVTREPMETMSERINRGAEENRDVLEALAKR
jgi:hypothetical protein